MKARVEWVVVIVLASAAVVALGGEGHGQHHDQAVKPQTQCPVMGGKIDKEVYTEYDGKRVYFCCPGCIAKFKEHPKLYLEKLAKEGVTLENAGKPQTTCPVLGGKIDKNVYADYKGKRVYFCCAGCVAKFKEDPSKYLKKLAEQGVSLEDVPAPKSDDPHGRTEKHNKQH